MGSQSHRTTKSIIHYFNKNLLILKNRAAKRIAETLLLNQRNIVQENILYGLTETTMFNIGEEFNRLNFEIAIAEVFVF